MKLRDEIVEGVAIVFCALLATIGVGMTLFAFGWMWGWWSP